MNRRGVVPIILAMWVSAVFVGGITAEVVSTRGSRAVINEVNRAEREKKNEAKRQAKEEKRKKKIAMREAERQARAEEEARHERILSGEVR